MSCVLNVGELLTICCHCEVFNRHSKLGETVWTQSQFTSYSISAGESMESLHGLDSSGIYPSLLFSAQGILALCTNRLPTACLKTGPFFPSGKPVVPPCTRLPLSIPSALSPSPFHARRFS